MDAEQTARSGSDWMMVAIALLALAVFSWGVRYKLSLYNPDAHMSAAKLLSQRERPATSETLKLATDPLVNSGPVTLFALAMGVMLTGLCILNTNLPLKDAWHQAQIPKQPERTFFFFRPPPVVFAAR
ncbi:MAG: hypothetical protein BGO25_19095 [Acidobacteriales bacterium 59-55]|nr:MAG: hypothetical protein BGO25_19095 [Acidobacteriales bacterium 59-55]